MAHQRILERKEINICSTMLQLIINYDCLSVACVLVGVFDKFGWEIKIEIEKMMKETQRERLR